MLAFIYSQVRSRFVIAGKVGYFCLRRVTLRSSFFACFLYLAMCKLFMRLTVIQVGWKARRCTWSLRMSFTTRSSRRAVSLLPINRTAPAAQASLLPARARRMRGRQRMAVSGSDHSKAVFKCSAGIFYSFISKEPGTLLYCIRFSLQPNFHLKCQC